MAKRTGFFARWRMERELCKNGVTLDPKTPIAEQYQTWQAQESARVLTARQQTRETQRKERVLQVASWERTQQAFEESRGALAARSGREISRVDPFAEWGDVYGRHLPHGESRAREGYER